MLFTVKLSYSDCEQYKFGRTTPRYDVCSADFEYYRNTTALVDQSLEDESCADEDVAWAPFKSADVAAMDLQ